MSTKLTELQDVIKKKENDFIRYFQNYFKLFISNIVNIYTNTS
jgi:hypothetical protein